MGDIFGGGSEPEPAPMPEPEAPAVTPEDAESKKAAEDERRRLMSSTGRQSTKLIDITSPYTSGGDKTKMGY